MSTQTSRRDFLKILGATGTLVLGAPLMGSVRVFAEDEASAFSPSIWLSIAKDGTATIVAHRSEMGTGIRTCLPAVLADELEADLERVSIDQAVGDKKYGSQNTDGSRSIRNFFTTMREVGATARHMLEAAAADTWGVPAAECTARDHAVHHDASKRSLGFGELVAKASTMTPPAKDALRLKKPEEWRYIGKDFPIHDGPDIVRGKAPFGMDVRLPGMKFATIERCPVLGGKLTSREDTRTLAVPGVERTVVIPDFIPPHNFQALGGVAVIASNTWAAIEGRRRLETTWDEGANASYDSTQFKQTLLEAVRKPGRVVRKVGDANQALGAASKKLAAEYSTPLLAHASMEPPCAVAHVTEDRCEVWAPTQNPQAALDTLAATLKMPKEQITVNVTLLGGGFGRKSKADFIAEAALLSKAVGAPVQVVWTREDDIRYDYYHAPAALHLEAGMNAEGKIDSWLQRGAHSSIMTTFVPGMKQPAPMELMLGFIDVPYAIPNMRLETCDATSHVRIGWLRAVCNLFNTFAIGSFTDELAHAAGKDPLDFYIASLGDDRKVDLGELGTGVNYPNYGMPIEQYPIETARLRQVAERLRASAWKREVPEGHGLGLCIHRSFHAYVGVVVEAAVKDGQITVPRVDITIDLGTVVNPDRVRAQMEGSVVFGLSLALQGEITAKGGRIEQSNFHDYPVQRIHETPRDIRVDIVESTELPGGAGEPGVPPVAPALANAIFAATGQRLRELPLRMPAS